MIGIDTNVLIRYLAQDDPLQSKKATARIESALHQNESIYLNHEVICEVCWVLGKLYGYSAQELAETLERIFSAAQFEFEDKDLLWESLGEYRSSGADFADCLIGMKNRRAGCGSTLTFDKRAVRIPSFSAV